MSDIKRKKILLLGSLRYLLPVIKAAHEEGYYVITCDYLPDNIAHKYSDEYHNVSITDKEAVLELAQELNIDGIMSFAVDPGVVTAAYVAEKMSLPSCGPYKSVQILQNKALFRKFLSDNGFVVPKAKSYSNVDKAIEDLDYFSFPIIVKPVDSAGSKGVTRVDNIEDLRPAVEIAFRNTISKTEKQVIIEEFIEKKGYSSDTDSFSVDGELKFVSFSSQRFDENAAGAYVPAAFSWPSTMNMQQQTELTSEIQRLLRLLRMRTSVYNIETRIGVDDKPYIMELSPRGGGNRLCEMLKYATGQDLIKNAVKAAVGDKLDEIAQPEYKGCWAEVILHTEKKGIFKELYIDKTVRDRFVVEEDLWIKKGDEVKDFSGANDAIGTLVLNFESQEQLNEMMNNQSKWLKVVVE
jgi:Carbamoylphosphate synthase large subunit (split gene in MJ)